MNCETIFNKMENDLKRGLTNYENEDLFDEFEDEEYYNQGIAMIPIQIIYKASESDDD